MKIVIFSHGYENLGLEYISASLKKEGFFPEWVIIYDLFRDGIMDIPVLSNIFNKNEYEIAKIICRKVPTVVFFSCITDNIRFDLKVAKFIKIFNKKIFICFGGIHATIEPERILNSGFIDAVCIGEGEISIVKLIKALNKKENYLKLEGFYFNNKGNIIKNKISPIIQNLDELPFPDKKPYFEKMPIFKKYYRIMTSRGCPFNCSFCNNNVLKKLYKKFYIRRRSPENVIEELKIAKFKYKSKFIIFEDDLFILNKKWLFKFLNLYKKKIFLPFQCTAYPGMFDFEILKKLRASGCKFIEIGIQTMDYSIRKNVFKRNETNSEIIHSLNLLKKSKIKYSIFHIFDIPGVSDSDEKKAMLIYSRYKTSQVNFVRLTYYPGTDILNWAINNNILSKNKVEAIKSGKISSYENLNKENKTIKLFGLVGILPYPVIKILSNSKWFLDLKNSTIVFKIMPALLRRALNRDSISARIHFELYIFAFKNMLKI